MLGEYLAELLARKVADGHCQVGADDASHLPCKTMQVEHFRMLREYREALEGLLLDIRQRENAVEHLAGP
jgi:hypothetical protein